MYFWNCFLLKLFSDCIDTPFAKQFLAIILPPHFSYSDRNILFGIWLLVNKNDSVLVLSVCFEKTTVEIYCWLQWLLIIWFVLSFCFFVCDCGNWFFSQQLRQLCLFVGRWVRLWAHWPWIVVDRDIWNTDLDDGKSHRIWFCFVLQQFCRQSHLQYILSLISKDQAQTSFTVKFFELWGGWYCAEKSAFRQIGSVCESFWTTFPFFSAKSMFKTVAVFSSI